MRRRGEAGLGCCLHGLNRSQLGIGQIGDAAVAYSLR